MVRGGKIYLFRDGMADTAEVTRTLWHELLHYGLRRFLTKDQYIATMKQLYNSELSKAFWAMVTGWDGEVVDDSVRLTLRFAVP